MPCLPQFDALEANNWTNNNVQQSHQQLQKLVLTAQQFEQHNVSMARCPPWRISMYEISKSSGLHVDFGFQIGFLDFNMDFWILKLISGFLVELF